MSRGRIGLAAVLVVLTAAAVWWIMAAPRNGVAADGVSADLGPPPESTRPLTLHASSECRTCHEEVFAEWQGSHHAIAYTNPEVQKLSKNFRDRDCLPCHSSRPVFETGLGNRVLEREVRLEEGVDCFSCHQFKNGMMASPVRLTGPSDAPCNPLPYAGIHDLGLCAPCHDQHKVMRDWKATEFAAGPGRKDCADCHMPAAERKAANGRKGYVGRSHAFPAAHDPETLRKALSLTTSIDASGRLLVNVKNDGAGHNVPADERHRAVDLVVVMGNASGPPVRALVDRYRNPYRDEFHLKNPLRKPGDERTYQVESGALGWADVSARRVPAAFQPDRPVYYPESTQIPAGEERAYVITLPRNATSATVRLIYKLNPFAEDDQGTLMREATHATLQATRAAPAERMAPVAPAEVASAMLDRAAAMLADARTRKQAAVPDLLRAVKDKSHSAFMVVHGAGGSPDSLQIEENPYGGDDLRSLERVAAISALADLGAREAIPELLLALDDRDGLPAVHAAEALARLGSRAGVPTLITALEHKAYENENANRMLKALSGEDFGFDSDSGMTARAAAVERWRTWWAAFEKSGARLRGEGAPFAKGVDAAADRRIARYVDVMGEFQFVFMEQARKMLRRLGVAAVPYLEDGVARAATKATWRAEIAHVLGGIGSPEAHRLLSKLAADAHPTVRARAIDALVASGAPGAAERVAAALSDADDSVVIAAARALGRVGTPADAEVLLARLRDDSVIELVREIDLARLRLMASSDTLARAARHLFEPSIAGRTATLDALNAMASRVVLDDPNASEEARRAAVLAWRAAILR